MLLGYKTSTNKQYRTLIYQYTHQCAIWITVLQRCLSIAIWKTDIYIYTAKKGPLLCLVGFLYRNNRFSKADIILSSREVKHS